MEDFTFMTNKKQEGEASLTFERPLREIQFLPMVSKQLVTGVYIMGFFEKICKMYRKTFEMESSFGKFACPTSTLLQFIDCL